MSNNILTTIVDPTKQIEVAVRSRLKKLGFTSPAHEKIVNNFVGNSTMAVNAWAQQHELAVDDAERDRIFDLLSEQNTREEGLRNQFVDDHGPVKSHVDFYIKNYDVSSLSESISPGGASYTEIHDAIAAECNMEAAREAKFFLKKRPALSRGRFSNLNSDSTPYKY